MGAHTLKDARLFIDGQQVNGITTIVEPSVRRLLADGEVTIDMAELYRPAPMTVRDRERVCLVDTAPRLTAIDHLAHRSGVVLHRAR